MHITTSGKPTKVRIALCKKAVQYYGDVLLQKRTSDDIDLHIHFSRDGLRAYEGNCMSLGRRSFTIQVDPDMGERSMLISLAHEMVHVKQWATGELTDYQHKTHLCRWKGRYYSSSEEDKNYWLIAPWEIDARGRELGLYKMFKKEPVYGIHARRRKR